MSTRRPAVAGLFYPADPDELAATVDELLARAAPPDDRAAPKAIVVPHAGYIYSGAIAASAYARVPSTITRVVLLGPAHRVDLAGIARPSVDAFRTPLGEIPLDTAPIPGVIVDDRAHFEEHSLEVQLPFLQRLLDAFTLLPLLVGRAEPHAVAAVLDAVWGGNETLIVVSTDLSHYETYEVANERDTATAAAVLAGRPDAISPLDACGAYPLRGLLTAAPHHDLVPELVDLRNSGDTAGSKDRVVGYGAFAFAS
jgi:AmmeMemoRadiSam system protein B